MFFDPPNPFNIADYFLDDRIREGHGGRPAIRTASAILTYGQVQERANRFANVMESMGVEPEQRVLIGLPDIPDFAASLFGALKCGAVGVMINCHLGEQQIRRLYKYTRAKAAVVHADQAPLFRRAARGLRRPPCLLTMGAGGDAMGAGGDAAVARAPGDYANFPSHPDDPAIWLFSGGTTGRPKGVIQSHASFANSTECYAKRVLGYKADDITISVPKLFFGYATGSNLFFPFAAGGSTVLFPERCTAPELFAQIARHQPSILINVPHHDQSHGGTRDRRGRSRRCCRSALSAVRDFCRRALAGSVAQPVGQDLRS